MPSVSSIKDAKPLMYGAVDKGEYDDNHQRRDTIIGSVFRGKSKRITGSSRAFLIPSNQRESGMHATHSFLYTLLNPLSRQRQALYFKHFISTIIVTDLFLFMASTDTLLSAEFSLMFYYIEGFVSIIFLIEYIARLVTIIEKEKYARHGPLYGRLRYAVTTGALIDLFATSPFFLELLTGWDLPTLTFLRVFRLLRILKTEGYVRAIDAVYRVIYYNREILYVAFLVCCFLVVLTAVLLYFFRPPFDPENADQFASIFATMYLSTLMLTGQGNPEGDLPWYTKGVVLLTSVFSVAMFAIPASMLTWGFEAEAARCAKQARKKHLKGDHHSQHSSSSNDSDSDGCSTDEEYFKIIAGEEDEDDSSEDSWTQAQKNAFKEADADQSGSISLKEFLRMQSLAAGAAKLAVHGEEVETPSTSSTTHYHDSRLRALEANVEENSQKLDRILQMLEQQR